MNRREFLKTTSLAAAGSTVVFAFGRNTFNFSPTGDTQLTDLAGISIWLEADFGQLMQWMKENGWTNYLQQALGVTLTGEGDALKAELIKKLDTTKLIALRTKEGTGFDDFAGEHLIKPGYPAFSLLYHALASPRVRSKELKNYPSTELLDRLENYIYALYSYEQLKKDYGITSDKDLVLAVFAYEYRPAFKTPHHQHADVVYSRTGIARVGNHPLNYDPVNRCYINKPKEAINTKQVAVTPARYGLFLAKKVKSSAIHLMKTDVPKPGDRFNDAGDAAQWFLQPVRKLFYNDLLIGESNFTFRENHRSEKIYRLYQSKRVAFADDLEPPVLQSDYLIVQEPLRNTGSTFLVISQEKPLIRHAKKDGQPLYFKVPPDGSADTRYFNAMNTQAVEDVELLVNQKPPGQQVWHNANNYKAPRNKPMFLNVSHERSNDGDSTYKQLQRDTTGSFEQKINGGNYDSPLFEDSICDGSVTVDVTGVDFSKLTDFTPTCLPAFSIVTAPDFFPQADCFDLLAYDIAPGKELESSFYEGGTASLATLRMPPNPNVLNTKDNTYTSVLTSRHQAAPTATAQKLLTFKDPTADKGYFVSGFLPDVASSIFAPGWDITYAGKEGGIYISTEGLGSPFTEDMKLCAAMNGMWPVASPDASRTYQGGLEPDYRNPTAIPLMDDEIGIHKLGPHTKGINTSGWDGEQGPYLEQVNGVWKVNFTDLGRADVVQNTLEGNLDMSKLRELTSKELLTRMACLKLCIKKLPKKNFATKEQLANMVGFTYHWLVSAESVIWGRTVPTGHGIPTNLVGSNKDWVVSKANIRVYGPGYLFVFADVEVDNTNYDWADYKRRRLHCENIYVCMVTETKMAWREILKGPNQWQS